jgi:hypothetical protein
MGSYFCTPACRISLSWLVFTSLNLCTILHRCSALNTGEVVYGQMSLLSRLYLRTCHKSVMKCSHSPHSRRKLLKHVNCVAMSDFEDFSGPLYSLQSSESDTGQSDGTKQNPLNVDRDRPEEHLLAFAKSDSPIKKRNLVGTSIPTKSTLSL